jgi:hypothetical protein
VSASVVMRACETSCTLAVSDHQRAMFDLAFKLLSHRLLRDGLPFDDMDCVRLPMAIAEAVGVEDMQPVSRLVEALVIMFTGFDLWDDAMDEELPAEWSGYSPAEISLAAAALIGGVGVQALGRVLATGRVHRRLSAAVAAAFASMAAGQAMDIAIRRDQSGAVPVVEQATWLKSGAALGLYAEATALLCGLTQSRVEAFRRMGQALGGAAQLYKETAVLARLPTVRTGIKIDSYLAVNIHVSQLPETQHQLFRQTCIRAVDSATDAGWLRSELDSSGASRQCAERASGWVNLALLELQKGVPGISSTARLWRITDLAAPSPAATNFG